MNSFATSTHYKNWIKTEEQLKENENSKYQRILKRVNAVNKIINKENEEKSHENTGNKIYQKYVSQKNLSFLKEEQILIINYSNKLIKLLNGLQRKSNSLKNYVLSYFRRFYFKKSILDYDTNFVMAAAFLLGAKLAAVNYSYKEINKIFPIIENNLNKLLEYEFYLCTILEYEFFVFNPYQALIGFIYILEQKEFFLKQDKENYINQDDFKNDCMAIIDKIYLTNSIFLYTYSEIALASIFIESENKNKNITDIVEKLDLGNSINTKEFKEKQVLDMKKKIEALPKYANFDEEEKKTVEIYKNVRNFLKTFPKYQAQLDQERINLKNKMIEFENKFREVEPKSK